MKLWQVVQWGNLIDGGNGPDTQCVISAVDMKTAIVEGEKRFSFRNSLHKDEWHDKADVVFLLGEDGRPEGEPLEIIQIWVSHAFNHQCNPAWHRDVSTDIWKTQEEMFGYAGSHQMIDSHTILIKLPLEKCNVIIDDESEYIINGRKVDCRCGKPAVKWTLSPTRNHILSICEDHKNIFVNRPRRYSLDISWEEAQAADVMIK